MKARDRDVDWVHPPADWHSRDLWECLHDARLEAFVYDEPERRLTLRFDCYYLNGCPELPDGVRVLFEFQPVLAMRVRRWIYAEPLLLDSATKIKGEGEVDIDPWLEVSVGITDVIHCLEHATADVSRAQAMFSPHSVALQFDALFWDGDSEVAMTINLLGRQLLARRADDGGPFDLEMLIKLGNGYWDAFAKRSEARQKVDKAANADG